MAVNLGAVTKRAHQLSNWKESFQLSLKAQKVLDALEAGKTVKFSFIKKKDMTIRNAVATKNQQNPKQPHLILFHDVEANGIRSARISSIDFRTVEII